MLNIEDPAKEETIPAVLRLGFRPFFLFSALFAAIAVPAWLISLYEPQYGWIQVSGLWWHPHELLFGYAMAVVAGFLLTAVQTWTGQPGMKGVMLAATFGSWLVARLLLIQPIEISLWVPALFDTLFLTLTAVKLGQSIIRVKQWRNIAFPPLLLFAGSVNLLSYQAIINHDFALASQIWESMIWWIAMVISVVGGRVIPFFTAKRLGIPKAQPLIWLDRVIYLCVGLLLIQTITNLLPEVVSIVLLGLGGVLQLLRMLRWSPLKTGREPLLWSLHVSYLCLPVSMIGLALFSGDLFAERQLIHLLAAGCIGGMCLSMKARVSLGHTSRNIYEGPRMWPAFLMILLAALIRAFLPVIWSSHTVNWHWISGVLWSVAFLMFVVHYAGILTRPRIDGRPG